MTTLQIYAAYSEQPVSDMHEHSYLAMMPGHVRESILRFKRWQDRQASLFGKLLLLRALKTQFRDFGLKKFHSLTVSRYGKPYIQDGPEFNISHSEGMVVVAVARHGGLGIDVEKIRPITIDDFSQQLPEVANLHKNFDADQVDAMFFDCWTRKEAVLKGTGKGLLTPLDQVRLGNGTAHVGDATWFVNKVPLDENYCCHVATEQVLEDVTLEYTNLMSDDFLCDDISKTKET